MDKKTNKTETKTYKRRMNIFMKAAILVFICACSASVINMMFEYNALKDKRVELEARIAEVNTRIEELNVWLDMPFNDDYVRRVAREKLNLRIPGEIIFYNDLIK